MSGSIGWGRCGVASGLNTILGNRVLVLHTGISLCRLLHIYGLREESPDQVIARLGRPQCNSSIYKLGNQKEYTREPHPAFCLTRLSYLTLKQGKLYIDSVLVLTDGRGDAGFAKDCNLCTFEQSQ